MVKFGFGFGRNFQPAKLIEQRGSAMVLTMVTSVVFISFLVAVSQVNRNLSSQFNSTKDMLAAFKSTQEIASSALATAYASGMSGVCPSGTVNMSMTSVNGNAVNLCMKGRVVDKSICIDNPNATSESGRQVCISRVGSGGTLSTVPVSTIPSSAGTPGDKPPEPPRPITEPPPGGDDSDNENCRRLDWSDPNNPCPSGGTGGGPPQDPKPPTAPGFCYKNGKWIPCGDEI